MKILIINLGIGLGSIGKIVESLYLEAVKSGYQCKIAYGRGTHGRVPKEDTYYIGSEFARYLHALFTRLFGSTSFYSRKSTRKLINWIEQYNPDVVSIHGVYGYYVNMPILYRYLSNNNKHVFLTLHSCWDFTGHCCHFTLNHCDKWKSDCIHCSHIDEYPRSLFFDNTKKNYRIKKELYNNLKNCTIICPSNWMAELAKESFLRNHPIITVYNGIDLSLFKPDFRGRERRRPLVLCVANVWTKWKGLDDIIELSGFADKKIDILVVGVKRKQIKSLPPNIIGIEKTSNTEELVKLYNQSTILFNPTYEDNYPTVNLEAIACHIPVVTYDTGGCIETIKDGKFGVVIKPKDYETLIKITLEVFNGQKVFDYSNIEEFSDRTMAQTYFNVFMRKN